jgi:hypothetical protein
VSSKAFGFFSRDSEGQWTTELAHWADRGTTIDVSRSYLEFQSFTEFLLFRENKRLVQTSPFIDNVTEASDLGTATRTVSRYSESWMKLLAETTSVNVLTERLPLLERRSRR